MMTSLTLVVALLALSANAVQVEKERPVQKVVSMLNEMKAQLEAEAEADQEAFDKMTCYCESNEKEKTKSVADAEARITELTALIEEMTAKSSTLSTEVDTLTGEVTDNTAALDKATDIRAKDNADFTADEANMQEGIKGLSGAVNALSKQHGGTALIQVQGHSFLQQKQAPTNSGSYAPQSGAIFGVLKQMKEGFETNLNDATKEEITAAKAFGEMKAAKTSEIQSGEASIQTKDAERAEADETAANSKTDLAETQASLAADNEFLANLKVECDNFNAEYSERTKTRAEEQAAVGDVIGMLTDDDAHDLFSRTYSFVQVKKSSSRIEKAASLVSATAKQWNRPSMMLLTASMRAGAGIDAFGSVKDKVNKMINDLMKEKGEEERTMDKCRSELKENGDQTEAANEQKDELTANIDDLTNTIANLKDAIATLNQEISETRVNMKRASEDREAENKEFQMTVADQRATQAILTKALDRLKQFYEAKSLLQTSKGAAPYKKSAASGGVMMMIEGVIKEAADLEKESLKAEQDAQTAYETMITDSNNSVAAKQKDIASKTELRGEKEGDLVTAEGDMKATNADLDALRGISNAIHNECDFLLKNFDLRQEARDNEVESLKRAVAMLSGADFR